MITSLKIAGFKNFRGKSIELTNLKRINILVGINGSGKSSVLEALIGTSKLSQLNSTGLQDILVHDLASRLHSLFEPQTELTFSYDTSDQTYGLKITTQAGDRWQLEKIGKPVGGTDVVAILRPGATPFIKTATDSTNRQENPFGGIKIFDRDHNIVIPDLDYANEVLAKVNPVQRHLRKMNLSSGQFTFEGDNEIRPEFLAGGSRYLAGISAAVREMNNNRPILVIDDLGDELFPAIRKKLIPEINKQLVDKVDSQFAQMFATTHNIELVKSALNHPEYCSVYMFDYDGTLVEFNGKSQKNTTKSSGINSSEAIPVVAKMLGLEDLDLGFPELVLMVEEETKKTLLNAVLNNPRLKAELKKIDILVPFQSGDGNTSKAIHNLLDLSKYLFFSDVWSDRYAIFTDYNPTDYEQDGHAKNGSQRQNALAIAQAKLVLNKRFILTRKGARYTETIEETYPIRLWQEFKKQNKLAFSTIQSWFESIDDKKELGKAKNNLAKFVGENITKPELTKDYPAIWRLIAKLSPDDLEPEESGQDDIYNDAVHLVVEQGKASTSLLQRRLRIGYGRAARIIEEMESKGIIGAADGSRPREVLVATFEEAQELY